MKILAIVVTYYPQKDLLERNITAFIDEVDKLLIWENTPEVRKKEFRYIDHPKVEYCGDGVNSISHALNYAWHVAVEGGYGYLLTMDQDSVFVNFNHFVESTVQNKQSPAGIWTPWFIDNPTQKNSCQQLFTEFLIGITSGMLQSVHIINKLGGWNESFFIDGVDTDYCLHGQRLGVKTYRVGGSYLIHRIGNPEKVSFRGRQTTVLNYSARRYYSIFRTHVLLTRMYKEQEEFKPMPFWLPQIKRIALLEKQGIKKLFYILAGIVMGYLCRIPNRGIE